MGKGPNPDLNYIYIGEIGDNDSKYDSKHIYRIAEFTVPLTHEVFDTLVTGVDRLAVQLPDGERDSEALVVDPVSTSIFLFSKREEQVHVYEIDNWAAGDQTTVARFLLHIPVAQITAADISRDGTELLLRNYDNIFYWKRDITKPLVSVFEISGRVLPYVQEPQGESVAFSLDGEGYYTVSEVADGKIPHLIFYKRKPVKED